MQSEDDRPPLKGKARRKRRLEDVESSMKDAQAPQRDRTGFEKRIECKDTELEEILLDSRGRTEETEVTEAVREAGNAGENVDTDTGEANTERTLSGDDEPLLEGTRLEDVRPRGEDVEPSLEGAQTRLEEDELPLEKTRQQNKTESEETIECKNKRGLAERLDAAFASSEEEYRETQEAEETEITENDAGRIEEDREDPRHSGTTLSERLPVFDPTGDSEMSNIIDDISGHRMNSTVCSIYLYPRKFGCSD
jgi:hypothetical protein